MPEQHMLWLKILCRTILDWSWTSASWYGHTPQLQCLLSSWTHLYTRWIPLFLRVQCPYSVQYSALCARFPHLKLIHRLLLTHCPSDGGNKHRWNIGKLVPEYGIWHSRRQLSSRIEEYTYFTNVIVVIYCTTVYHLHYACNCIRVGNYFSFYSVKYSVHQNRKWLKYNL
jgi:hypothetical protein